MQHTVARSGCLSGIALHTGNRINLTIHPAPVDSGIVFCRTDLPGCPSVRAGLDNVVETRRATTIADGDAMVYTVEHLLAVFYAFDIDNVRVDMTGPEPPIGDGSAASFVELVEQAGRVEQAGGRRVAEVTAPLYYAHGETRLVLLPGREYTVSCLVKYNCTPLDCQYLSLPIQWESFVSELARARTFCSYDEIASLIDANLICGGSLDNAIVMKDGVILSKEGLRYSDEFVRHKILDIIGDFALLGRRVRGELLAIKPGHGANIELARDLDKQVKNGENG